MICVVMAYEVTHITILITADQNEPFGLLEIMIYEEISLGENTEFEDS